MPEEGARPVTPEAVLSDSDASGPELSKVNTSVDKEAPQSPVGPVKSGALLLAHERDLAAPAPVSPSVASAAGENEVVRERGRHDRVPRVALKTVRQHFPAPVPASEGVWLATSIPRDRKDAQSPCGPF
jgi:hypothetical protein